MKTLVLHPEDPTTAFLDIIYKDKGYTVITDRYIGLKQLKSAIRKHDRIMMMGHGCPYGLLGFTRMFMDRTFIRLLRTKDCVCIWCNADRYVEREGIRGFYTGMFISEIGEAYANRIIATQEEVTHSNYLFVRHYREVENSPDVLNEIKTLYDGDSPVIKFNNNRLYYRDDNIPIKQTKKHQLLII
jgi:hypothetical protein